MFLTKNLLLNVKDLCLNYEFSEFLQYGLVGLTPLMSLMAFPIWQQKQGIQCSGQVLLSGQVQVVQATLAAGATDTTASTALQNGNEQELMTEDEQQQVLAARRKL